MRQLIFDATLEAIRELGYEAATIDEIVRRVEISQPTFYKYYASKEAVLREYATRGWAGLLRVIAERPGGVYGRLRDLFMAVAFDVTRDSGLWYAIAVSNAYNPIRDPQVLNDEEAGTRVLERLLERGQNEGELSCSVSPQLMASVLEGIMLRAIIEWGAKFPDDRPLEERMLAMLDFFMRGAAPTYDDAPPSEGPRVSGAAGSASTKGPSAK